MTDNSTQGGNDTIRDLDRSGSGPKTQVFQLDHGGTGATESLTSRANPLPVYRAEEAVATFRGRAQTFRIPGLAGTAGQKLFALHNATGSTKVVHINQITVDLMSTVAKAITVAPPLIRIHRFTVIPSGGAACAKVAKDTLLSSNASVTAWQGASADGTGATLTVTIPASSNITQEFAPRQLLTGTAASAFYEPFDRATYLEGFDLVLRALEGVVVNLDYSLATQNPTTDTWVVGCDWYEV